MRKKLIPSRPGPYVTALIIGLVVMGLYLWREGFDRAYAYFSGLTTAGILLVLFGLLILAAYWGAGDSLGYAFTRLRETHRKTADRERLAKQSYFDYLCAKKEKRSHEELTFMSYVLVGLVFLVVGLIVESAFIHSA